MSSPPGTMRLTVHILHDFDDAWLDQLRARLHPEITVTAGKEVTRPVRCDILVAGRCERSDLADNPDLRALIIPWAGLPVSMRELLADFPDLPVHNLHHNAAPAAEIALSLMMAVMKNIVPVDRAFRRHDWRPRYNEEERLLLFEGRTAVVLGYGAIGKRVARACDALGMKVQAIRRRPGDGADHYATYHGVGDLRALLPFADVLFVTLPLTPETEGMLGRVELALLPDRATIVNIARGPIVDQRALFDELTSGRIRAGLDVWYNYPTDEPSRASTDPADLPFHELDNVVMTPHLGGNSDRTEALRIAELADSLNAAATGQTIPNRVDLSRGY
ncbi:hydroxyacid dehydrogenase [candidate division GN15 bacterium]|nr:hydroxyacid dehydrogenase [candidate division GN15 bacterium]